MQYYRCKCGKVEFYGSSSPKCCHGCSKCNTSLERFKKAHKEPEPHIMIKRYNEVTGEPYKICRWCMNTEEEIKKKNDKYIDQEEDDIRKKNW